MTPDIAIVLATGRDSPYLAEAIASVRAQTVEAWEIVIVDNGVRDLPAVERMIADEPRAELVSIAPKATVAEARNVGVARTSAPLITFIDDDDVWSAERLARHLAAHRSNPSAPAVVSGYWHMDADGKRFGRDWVAPKSSAEDLLRGLRPTPVCGALSVRRADFIAVGGFSSEIPLMSDFELILRLLQRGSFVPVDELLMGYRRHSANITSTAPANARTRRTAMTGMVERQRWAAEARNDRRTADLLAERARRQYRDLGSEAGARCLRLIRRGELRDAYADFSWGIRHAPKAFLSGAAATVTRRRRV